MDRGFDFALPYVANRQGKPTVNGIAMFDGTRMTGKLASEESKVYMLLLGQKKDNLRLTLKAVDRERDDGYSFVTVDVGRIRRKLKVAVSGDGQVSVKLNLKLRVTVIEDPSNRLYRMDVVRRLERFLSEQLTDRSRRVVGKMQKARHDGFGIARTLMARHPKAWKGMEWKEEYPHIAFDTSVSVRIANTGITR